MDRRGFLKGLLGGAAAIMAAPAIVRAESLMKIAVPNKLARNSIYGARVPWLAGDFDGDVVQVRGMTKSMYFIDEAAWQHDADGILVSKRRRKQTLDTSFYNQIYAIPLKEPKPGTATTRIVLPQVKRIIVEPRKIFC